MATCNDFEVQTPASPKMISGTWTSVFPGIIVVEPVTTPSDHRKVMHSFSSFHEIATRQVVAPWLGSRLFESKQP